MVLPQDVERGAMKQHKFRTLEIERVDMSESCDGSCRTLGAEYGEWLEARRSSLRAETGKQHLDECHIAYYGLSQHSYLTLVSHVINAAVEGGNLGEVNNLMEFGVFLEERRQKQQWIDSKLQGTKVKLLPQHTGAPA